MKNTRKKMLLSSIAMLLVALVALGSATYAWFTINKEVEADTMKVNAKVAAGLQITNNNGGNWERKVSYSSTAEELTPISIPGIAANATLAESAFVPMDVSEDNVAVAGKAKAWSTITISSERPTLSTAAGSAGSDPIQGKSANSYFEAYRMGIRSSDETTDLGAVKATITCAPDAAKKGEKFAKAVLLDSSNKIVAYYNDATYKPISTASDDSFTTQAENVAASAQATISNSVTSAQYYTLLAWYEGNDAECVNVNQGAAANFTVTFTL